MALEDELLAMPTAPAQPRRPVNPERDFTQQIEITGDKAEATVRAEAGKADESNARDLLMAQGEDPEQWVRTGLRMSRWTMANGEEGESNRYTFARRGTVAGGTISLPDLDDLHQAVKRVRRKAAPELRGTANTNVGVIADPQIGKVSERGGVSELLERLEVSRLRWEAELKVQRPQEIFVVDNGDSIENFENVGSQDRTNDLQLTEQIRVWRRVFWTWIETAAALAPVVKVVGVPSNHCRVRRGRNNMATPADDFGIEVLTQVSDMAAVHPEKYGHVSFYAPSGEGESVAIPAIGGKILGFAHGHQVSKPESLGTWLAGQALGRTPIGFADIAVFGHWHNLRVQTIGDDRWIFIAPTSDNGSAWFRNVSGHESAPGVLSFMVDEGGWRDLHMF